MRGNLDVPPERARDVAVFIRRRLEPCAAKARQRARSRAIFVPSKFAVKVFEKGVTITLPIFAFEVDGPQHIFGLASQRNDLNRLGKMTARELKYVFADAFAGCALCSLGKR